MRHVPREYAYVVSPFRTRLGLTETDLSHFWVQKSHPRNNVRMSSAAAGQERVSDCLKTLPPRIVCKLWPARDIPRCEHMRACRSQMVVHSDSVLGECDSSAFEIESRGIGPSSGRDE